VIYKKTLVLIERDKCFSISLSSTNAQHEQYHNYYHFKVSTEEGQVKIIKENL